MLNSRTGRPEEKSHIAQYWLQNTTAGGCNKEGVERQE